MSNPSSPAPETPIPILLLKSPSPTPPTDPYTTYLTSASPNTTAPTPYSPHYIPVLTHTLLPDSLITLLLTHLQPYPPNPSPAPLPYGALIFTSQRAVAAFTTCLKSPPIQNRLSRLKELRLDFYTVGPATERSLRGVRDQWMPSCGLYGGEGAGSGEVLARIMLGREGNGEAMYTARQEGGRKKKPVLFLTGEKRRDVIPRMLMDAELGKEERVQVDEMVVYETRELEEFEFSFARVLGETQEAGIRWVVVFSPTAGRGMLKALGWLDESSGKVKRELGERMTFIACIGPTTREYLDKEFGFEADVAADKPSPQGVKYGIEKFMREKL